MDIKQLKKRCEMNWADFEGEVWSTDKPYRQYRLIDNGQSVLAIAHLDYVGRNKTFDTMWHEGRQKAFHGGMDDRSGAYIILDLLPQLLQEMPYDVLLTTDEESHQSTAEIFAPPRAYNWMFEFDREGLDAVMYDYGNEEWDAKLKSYGWRVDRGTGSDICKLYHLGCRGFNFGNGNHDGHTIWNNVDLLEMETSVNWFLKFWKDHRHLGLPFNEKTDRRKTNYVTTTYWGGGGAWSDNPVPNYGGRDYRWDEDGQDWTKLKRKKKKRGELLVEPCEDCGTLAELDPNYYLCERCRTRYEKEGVTKPSSYGFRTHVLDEEVGDGDIESDVPPTDVQG